MVLSLKSKLIIVCGIVCTIYFVWYYYIDTLSMSEIIGQTESSETDILVNFFDFDTGVTRNELQNLVNKSQNWNTRMNEINKITDSDLQYQEQTKLVAEMMQDPAFKKFVKLFFKKSIDAAKSTLELLNTLK